MTINIGQFRHFVLVPTLEALGLHSIAAEQLLMGTAMQESGFKHLRQLPHNDGRRGPALGFFQMEPRTHDDIWKNWLQYRQPLAERVEKFMVNGDSPDSAETLHNLPYATIMARLLYRRIPAALPGSGDVSGLAAYWKQHYNTPLGAGTVEQFETSYAQMLGIEHRTRA